MIEFFTQCIQAEIDKDQAYCREHGYEVIERTSKRFRTGDLARAIFGIDNEADMLKFYNGYVAVLAARPNHDEIAKRTPQEHARADIGHMFGEGMKMKHQPMWQRVCGAGHSWFGGGVVPPMSPEEIVEKGIEAAKARFVR